MGDKTVTIAKTIACNIADVVACSVNKDNYINKEVPGMFDSYTCTSTQVKGLMFKDGAAGSVTAAFSVLCTGTKKLSDLFQYKK